MSKITIFLVLAGFVRYILIFSNFSTTFRNRVEITTPLNSYKKILEGAYLYKNGIDPFSGDMVHESPMVLLIAAWIINNFSYVVPFAYIFMDLVTGYLLLIMAKCYLKEKIQQEKSLKFVEGTDDIQLKPEDVDNISTYVLLAYLFNPFTIMNCVAFTSTVIGNLLLSFYFLFLVKKRCSLCLIAIAIETVRNLYPIVLIAPAILVFSEKSVSKAVKILCMFIGFCLAVCFINYLLIGNVSFIENTIGFIFYYRDLKPNIGVFWYFFTEMFDHFRTMFLITFQMNATVLYLIPLSIKLRNEPLMLGTILISLIAIFSSYPCIGSTSFYIAFLPFWRRCWKFMAHNFVVLCFFLITILVMPALWHLWIYAGSANANFYFGITLAFSTGEIFLTTDLLFAYVKREFCLKHGQKLFVNGKEAKIILE